MTSGTQCKGCGKLLGRTTSPSRWCAECKPANARVCPLCSKDITTLWRRVCDACYEPGRNAKDDAKRRAQRRARGLKGRRVYVWDGELLCATEIARRVGVKSDALLRRLKKTDDIHEAVRKARVVS